MKAKNKKILNELRAGKLTPLFRKKILKYAFQSSSRFICKTIPVKYILKGLSVKPLAITIATTNICNANCIFCGYQFLTAPKGIMNADIFEKTVNDFVRIKGGGISFTPPVGEPLIDPDIIERTKYCRKFPEIRNISFFTNGIALSNMDLKQLLTCGINNITISIGGFDTESYKQIFRVDRFHEVYNGICQLSQINKVLGKPVKITIDLRCHESLDQLMKRPAYKEISQLVDNISYVYNYDSSNGRVGQADLLGFMRIRELELKSGPCSMFYAHGPTILWNGDVVVCGCRDNDLILGNIMENSLISLWQGAELRKLRNDFWRGDIPKSCINCAHYNSIKILKTFDFWKQARKNMKLKNYKIE